MQQLSLYNIHKNWYLFGLTINILDILQQINYAIHVKWGATGIYFRFFVVCNIYKL